MTEAKFKDIISTMIEFGWLDPVEALVNKQYLLNRVNMYVYASNIAREAMHMEPLV